MTKPSIEKVAQNFSEIFRRNVSKEEAQKLVNNYKELLNIENTEEFCNKAFKQIKKDYGYEGKNIPLLFKGKSTHGAAAGWETRNGAIYLYVDKNQSLGTFGRKGILRDLLHEFQHVKQSEYQYRTSPSQLFDALQKNTYRHHLANTLELSKEKFEIIAKASGMTVNEIKEVIIDACKSKNPETIVGAKGQLKKRLTVEELDKIKRRYSELFGDFKPFEKNSNEYELGLKYIENTSNYIPSNIDKVLYKKQILEADAFATEPKFNEIYNSFASIWRIF